LLKQKRQRGNPGCLLHKALASLFGGGFCDFGGCSLAKTIAETLDTTTHVVHGFLCTGVERV
jgi:hypothetical protein